MNTKTQFARGGNPFAPKAPKAPMRFVDPDALSIANDPLPSARAKPGHKYDAMFSKLKPGQCLVCEGPDAGKIGHALTTWLKRNGKDGVIRSTKNYEGAVPGSKTGRVWLIVPDRVLRKVA